MKDKEKLNDSNKEMKGKREKHKPKETRIREKMKKTKETNEPIIKTKENGKIKHKQSEKQTKAAKKKTKLKTTHKK